MSTQISFKSRALDAWRQKLGLEAPEFEGASIAALNFYPEEARLFLALEMRRVPESSHGFQELKGRLKKLAQDIELKVAYESKALSVEEYLGLHFEDLLLRLALESKSEAAWFGRLDYESGQGNELILLCEGALFEDRLRLKKIPQRLKAMIEEGCGEGVELKLRVDSSMKVQEELPELPAAAPEIPSKTSSRPEAAPSKTAPPPSKAPGQAQVQVLVGKAIPDSKISSMKDLNPGERVVLEGRLFGETDQRILGQERRKRKIRFYVSDGSDSMIATLWLEPEEAVPKPLAKGATGAWLRLRGKIEVDTFERGEMVLKVDDLMLLPPRLKRLDNALEKRVELHAHTKMSSNDSVVDIGAYVERAIAWGHEAVAITDHGVVHAFPDAFKASEKGKKIKLILGCEAYLVSSLDFLRKRGEKISKEQLPHFNHIILLVKNEKGRKNLYKLVSQAHLKNFYKKPLISKEELNQFREGLVLGSACENGELLQAVLRGAPDTELLDIASFYDYLEVQPAANNAFMLKQGILPDHAALQGLVRKVIELGEKLGKPVVATGDVHFLDPEDEVYRRILQSGIGMEEAEEQPPLYFKTTEEMLKDFAFLGDEEARRLVVENPRAIAASCELVPPVPSGRFFPEIANSEAQVREVAEARAKELFGETLPDLVRGRLDRELEAVLGNGFASLYWMARLLVLESEKRGYSVGSRGSVGSSFLAFLLRITEVNPLAAHERCEKCSYCEFYPNERLSGLDLKARPCPQCQGPLRRDGHNIPFETFVGFKGDKVPDIDLNFAPEVQGEIQKYVKGLFGEGKVYKAGTVSTYSNKTAFGFVKKYLEARNQVKRGAEIERIKEGLEGVKRTTGQHPGGVVLVKEGSEITDFTPIQFPGDSKELGGSEGTAADDLVITHFDYHSYDENLVKLDILGKDDASALRFLEEMTGLHESGLPLNDPEALSIFSSRKALGMPPLNPEEESLFGSSGVVAIPEFGTENTRRMLELTKPKSFTELIYISGLSHGTNVWKGNAADLIREKKASLDTVISTRDDIMNTLIRKGMDPATAFKITEKVRKGAAARDGFSPEEEQALKGAKVETWWIESCKKIEYMFPKAHAVAYCFTAMRMAYFKVHQPRAFYASWLTLHAEDLEHELLGQGKEAVLARIRSLRQARVDNSGTPKDDAAMATLVVAYEAMLRGIIFEKVDLYKSHPTRFLPGEGKENLLPPLVALAGLGRTAAEHIEEERRRQAFRSVEDLAERAGLNKSVIEKLGATGALDILPSSNQISLL